MKIILIRGLDQQEEFNSFDELQVALPVFPKNVELYKENISKENLIELNIENIEFIKNYEGTLIFLQRPAAVALPYLAAAVVAAGAYYGYKNLKKLMNMFKKPNVKEPKADAFSNPANRLEPRQNTSRIGGRIADIMGQVRIVPDLLAPPIRFFENNVEVEVVHMLVGIGDYLIEDVREDLTPIGQISGATVLFYRPGKWPGSLIPDAAAGASVTGAALNLRKYYGKPVSAVSGQTLKAPNGKTLVGDNNIIFEYPNVIKSDGDVINFLDYYEVGQTISGLDEPGLTFTRSSVTYHLGPFTAKVKEAYSTHVVIDHNWPDFGADSPTMSPTLYSIGDRIIGPFKVEKINDLPYSTDNRMELYFNFYAAGGLQYSEDDVRKSETVTITIKLEALNPSGSLSGQVFTTSIEVQGSGVSLSPIGKSFGVNLQDALPGHFGVQVSVWRSSQTRSTENQNVIDEVVFRDLYVSHLLPGYLDGTGQQAFEGMLSLTAIVKTNSQSSAVGTRKLNCLVTRKLQTYNDDGTLGAVAATKKARDAFMYCATNPKLGGFQTSEIDTAQICSVFKSVETYFGSPYPAEFSYAFDQADITVEESLDMIADAAFCSVYRRNNKIRIFFEKVQNNSTMLFNHRNMMPGSQRSSLRFGGLSGEDGVKYEYINPADDFPKIIYIPADQSAKKPVDVKQTGVRQPLQAYFHANRIYNKLKYRTLSTNFTAMEEAALVERDYRILVADQTRPKIQDGEVLDQTGLVLELSQPVEFISGQTYSIFLQHKDGTVESIPITAGVDEYRVVLNSAPSLPLVTSYEAVVRTGYLIVGSGETSSKVFVINSKQPNNDRTYTIEAVNYDSRFYSNDLDYINGLIDDGTVPIPPDPTPPDPEEPGAVDRTIYISTSATAMNLKTYYEATYPPAVSGDKVHFIVQYGVIFNGSNVGGVITPALDTGTWASGVNLKLTSQTLRVEGAGGNGGYPASAQAGQKGGTALKVRSPITIDNTLGGFKGGGGGGAGTDIHPGVGGVAGNFPGGWAKGGTGGTGNPMGLTREPTSFGSVSGQPAIYGGTGGSWGEPGGDASDADEVGSEDNVGGAAGWAVDGNSLVTWISTGVRIGPLNP